MRLQHWNDGGIRSMHLRPRLGHWGRSWQWVRAMMIVTIVVATAVLFRLSRRSIAVAPALLSSMFPAWWVAVGASIMMFAMMFAVAVMVAVPISMMVSVPVMIAIVMFEPVMIVAVLIMIMVGKGRRDA
jgi:hypothetical protein